MVIIGIIFSIVLAYILGSISPAYFFGKILKGIDIREVGDKNAGTTNVYKTLGITPAIITAIYDLTKGLLAMFIAFLFGVPVLVIYLCGIAAIIGHIFPFYLNYRGGQGVATATGMMVFFLIILYIQKALPLESIGFVLIIILTIWAITKQKGFLSLIVMPYLIVLVLRDYDLSYLTIFTSIIILHIFGVGIYEASKRRIFEFKDKTIEAALVWRTLLRPLAIVFPLALFYTSRENILWVLGVIGGIFLLLDLVRLASGKINLFFFNKIKFIFKKREEKRFSSITLFFLSSFITIWLFNRDIAILSLSFLVFGDVFAKFFGIEYGRTKIFSKTLEGSTAHFLACLIVGYLLWPYLSLSPVIIISGAIIATLTELVPMGINDNFAVPLMSALFLSLIKNL